MRTETRLTQRNMVTSASIDGIVVKVNGKEQFRTWAGIVTANAAIVEQGGATRFIVALFFDDDSAFVVRETEPPWASVIEHIEASLPGIEPFSSWGPRLLAEPTVLVLFDREGQNGFQ